MSKKIGWVSAAIMAAACSGGGGGGETPAPSPGDIGTPPPTTPPAQNMPPVVSATDLSAQLDGGSISVPINVSDPDGDPVELVLIDAPDWISLSEDGQLTGTPDTDQPGSYEVYIEASDGTNTSQITLTLTLFMDPVEQALATGDYTYIARNSDTDVATVLLNDIEAMRERNKAALRQMYQMNEDGTLGENSLTEVVFNPDDHSTVFRFVPEFGHSFPIMTSNTSDNPSLRDRKYHFALAGFYDDTRYTVLSVGASGDFIENSHAHLLYKNAIEWSLNKEPVDLNIVIAQHYGDHEDSEIRTWLRGAFPDQVSFNVPRACDSFGFSICLADNPDLLVLYEDVHSEQELDLLVPQIQAALESGVPLFFVRSPVSLPTNGISPWRANPLGSRVQEFLNFSTSGSNENQRAYVSNASPLDYVYGWEPDFVDYFESLVRDIEAESFNFDLSECTGPVVCEENPDFQDAIGRRLSALPNMIALIDETRLDPFSSTEPHRFYASVLLIGDYYRSLTTFPMPKATTSSNDIVRALFGELTAVIYRKHNLAMPDMGTFSRSTFTDGLLEDVDVSVGAGPGFRTSGVYAIPGETVSVTYLPTSEKTHPVSIKINSISAESGDPFRTVNGQEYQRPVLVSSNELVLNLGETIEFTSAFGGPIHVHMLTGEAGSVDLSFSNVARHPVWAGPEDTEKFLIDLAADEFDWAEIVRPSFELHSTVENMQATLDNPRYSGPVQLAEGVDYYLLGWHLWLDGHINDYVPENPDLIAFREERQIASTPNESAILHRNSGVAACVGICSGNPEESFAPLDPLSRTEQRHAALASNQLRFSGADIGSIVDLFVIHSDFRRFLATGETDSECPALPHEDLYATIQAGHASGDAQSFIEDEDLRTPEQQNAIYVQLMTALQSQGALDDGWNLLARFNTLEYEDSQNNTHITTPWPGATQTALCWDGQPQSGYRNRERYDKLLVRLSCASRYDLTAYLEMWGYEFGSIARDQVEKLNLPELEPTYYAIPPTGHCMGLDHPELPIDGVTTWPN